MSGSSTINALNLSPSPAATLSLSHLPLSALRSSTSTSTSASDGSIRGSESDETECSGWQLPKTAGAGNDVAFLGLPTEMLQSPGASPRCWRGTDTAGGTVDDMRSHDGSAASQPHQYMPPPPILAPVLVLPAPILSPPSAPVQWPSMADIAAYGAFEGSFREQAQSQYVFDERFREESQNHYAAFGCGIANSRSAVEPVLQSRLQHEVQHNFSDDVAAEAGSVLGLHRTKPVRSCPGRWGNRKIDASEEIVASGAKITAERWADVSEDIEEQCAPKSLVYLRGDAGSLPSRGSASHAVNKCKPCAFLHTDKGCSNGVECTFCHLCEQGEKKRRQAEKLERKRRQRQDWNSSKLG